MKRDKALVIETGEVLDIEFQYLTKKVNISFVLEEISSNFESQILAFEKESSEDKEGNFYVLSNGQKYQEDELIIGIDNIREYKLKKII